MRVLACGATGQFAGLVVPTLVSRGVQVRALVHDPAKQDRVRDAGADQAVVGDLRDPAGMRAALDGVDGVFLIIPAFAPDSAALGAGGLAACLLRRGFHRLGRSQGSPASVRLSVKSR